MLSNKILAIIVVVISALLIAFLIFGIPGYLEPNPVIALKVLIGVVLGIIVLVYQFKRQKK